MNNQILTNIKGHYFAKIKKNKLIISSLSVLQNSLSTQDKIQDLRKENKFLKKNYKLDKKRINDQNNSLLKKAIVDKKKLQEILRSQKTQLPFGEYIEKRKEYNFLVNKIKEIKIKKQKDIYGNAQNQTKNKKLIFYGKIALLIFILFLFLLPFWLIMTFSTKTSIDSVTTNAFVPSFNGGAKINYQEAMEALDIWNSIITTLFLTIVSNILILFFSSMAAWQLVRSQTWYSKILFYFFVIAMILPFQAIMIPMLVQFRKSNLTSVWGTVVAYMGFGMALSIFVLHGFLKNVPVALEESATISGMNPFQVFFKVVLPLLRTTFVTILVLNVMWIWNDYLLPSLLLNSSYGPQTLQIKLIRTLVSSVSSDLKAISAGVTILVIPPIIYFIFAQKKMISGITHGSIK